MTQLYVLAEQQGFLATNSKPMPQEIVELMFVTHATTGKRVAVFFSRLDAELCCQYANQQTWKGKPNSYECRPIKDSSVQFILRSPKRYGMACVNGFVTNGAGRLIISGNLYSLGQVTLHADDAAWMRSEAPRPDRSFLESVQVHFERMGFGDHLSDCATLDDWDQKAIEKQARIALAAIGFTASGDERGFTVYSPSRKAWRKWNGGV